MLTRFLPCRARLPLLLAAILYAAACSSAPDEVADVEPVVERPSPDYSEAPEGYVAAEVLGAVATPMQSVVLLGSEDHGSLLPISVNPAQAMAIQLGLNQERFERPLTHDLVLNILDQTDNEVAKIQVDALRGGIFYATIFLITPTEILEIDARPSDAIALAVTRGQIPIYVATQVLDEAGFSEDDLHDLPPADPGDPQDFHDVPTTPL